MSDGRIALLHLGRSNSSSSYLVSFFDPSKLLDGSGLSMAAIDSPNSGSLVRPVFAVTGTAQGDTYELSVNAGNNTISVSSGQATIVQGLLGVAHCDSLQDGPVEIILRVTGAEGSQEIRRSVLLDSSGPVVSLDSPADYASVTATTTIVGRATDANLTKWTLELGKPVSYQGYQWSTLAQGTSSIVGPLASFNPTGYANGVYRLRLRAVDAAGNTAEDEVVFSLGYVALTDIIKVSPDQAGYSKYSAMMAMLPDDSFLMVNSSGHLVHWAADGSYLGTFPWTPPVTGLQVMAMTPIEGGVLLLCGKGATFHVIDLAQDGSMRHWFTIPLGDGRSMVRSCQSIIGADDRVFIVEGNEIEVFSLSGSYLATWGEYGRDSGEFYYLIGGVRDQFDRLCFVDTLGKLHFYSIDGQYRGQVDLKDEKGSNIYTLRKVIVDPHGNFFVSTYADFYIYRSDGTYLAKYPSVFGWIPGAFESDIAMTFDSHGNLWTYDKKSYSYDDQSCTFQVFDIDWDGLTQAIPSVAFYQPPDQGYIPAESWIQGKIVGGQSAPWRVEIGEGTSPNTWIPVADGNGEVETGIIARLDADELSDGIYTLRLTVDEDSGIQTEVRRTVMVDKTPPVVIIDQPIDRVVLQESSEILGSITDAHPASYRLKYYGTESQYTVNQQWWTIGSGSSYPAGGTLATWQSNFLNPDVFRLKTMAVDLANNLTVVNRDVSRHPLRFIRDVNFIPFNYYGNLYYLFLASASRDGRVAVTYQNAPKLSVYTEDFEFIREIAPVPDAGYTSFQIAAVSFARTGDLYVVGNNSGDGRTKLLQYSADGMLLGSYLIPTSGTSSLGTWVGMEALNDGSIAFWGYTSSSSWWIKVYSLDQGLVRTFAAPAKGSSYSSSRMSVFALDPEGDIVLPANNSSGVLVLEVYSPEGVLLRTINPPTGGWKSSYYTNLAVDGNGSYLLLSGLKVDKYSPTGEYLWSSGAMGPYPGRKDNTYVYLGVLAGRAGRFLTFEYVGKIHTYEALDAWVDDEGPALAFDTELGTQPLRGMVEILGTITESRLASWRLWALPDGDASRRLLLGSGVTSVENDTLAQWNTTGLDGEWLLMLEAGDSSGNRAEIPQWVTVLNLTAPIMDVPISPVAQSSISITGQGLSGSIAYGFLNGVEVAQAAVGSDGRFTLQVGPLIEGGNTILTRLGDGQGHYGPTSEAVTVIADYTRPEATVHIGLPRYLGEIIAVRSQTIFTVEASDIGTGVGSIEYRIDDGEWAEYAPFSVTGEGSHIIRYRSQDHAGNSSLVGAMSVLVDDTPPTSQIIVGGPKYMAGTLYVGSATPFSLSAHDAGSGISLTEYRIDGGEWIPYTAPFVLNSEGNHRIVYRSVDRLGLAEDDITVTAVVDDTPPTTEIVVGNPQYQGVARYISPTTSITLTASDAGSGVDFIDYRVDSGTWQVFATPFFLTGEGAHQIGYRSVDHLGRISAEQVLSVVVDSRPPENHVVIGEPKYQGTSLFIGSMTPIALTSDDQGSGVALLEYRIDGGAWQPYAASFTLAVEGAHQIEYRSQDRLGFASPVEMVAVVVDATPPVTSVTIGQPKHQGTWLFVSGATPISLESSDTASGVAARDYRISPTGAWQSYTASVTLNAMGITEDGVYTFEYRGRDNLGNLETAGSIVIKRDDMPPLIDAGDDISVFARMDGYQEVSVQGVVSDGEGFDPMPSITWSEDGSVLATTAAFNREFALKRHTLVLQATDHLGNTASDSLQVLVMPRQAELAYTGGVTAQWSDWTALEVAVTDVTQGQDPVPLVGAGPVTFRVMADGLERYRYVVTATDTEGFAAVEHLFADATMPAGSYVIRVEFEDGNGVFASRMIDVPFTLEPELGGLDYSGNRVVSTSAENVTLQATVYQDTNEELGRLIDFNAATTPVFVSFQFYKFTQVPDLTTTPYYVTSPIQVVNSTITQGVGVATVTLPLSVLGAVEENYTVAVSLVGEDFISAPVTESTLAVYNPTGSFITGGGTVSDPTTAENHFSFALRYGNSGQPQGNLILFFKDEVARTKTRVKSNALNTFGYPIGDPPGTPTAIAEGRCNVEVYDLDTGAYLSGQGNLRFVLTAEDRDATLEPDTFRLEVRYPDGVPYEPVFMDQAEPLIHGDVKIHP